MRHRLPFANSCIRPWHAAAADMQLTPRKTCDVRRIDSVDNQRESTELRSLSLFFSSGKFPAEHLSRYSVIFVKFSALVVFCDPTRSYTNCSITRCNRVMPNYASHEQNSVDAQNSSQHLSAKMISCLLHDKCRQGRKSQILVLEVKSSVLVLEPC